MATRTRIIGVPVQDTLSIWRVDYVMWWPVDELIQKIGKEGAVPGFRESVDSSMYLDHVGIFNKEEFIRLNEEYKAAFLANQDKKPLHDDQKKRMNEVDALLKKRVDIKWILVENFEWESGY
jgi:hypothetical protein